MFLIAGADENTIKPPHSEFGEKCNYRLIPRPTALSKKKNAPRNGTRFCFFRDYAYFVFSSTTCVGSPSHLISNFTFPAVLPARRIAAALP